MSQVICNLLDFQVFQTDHQIPTHPVRLWNSAMLSCRLSNIGNKSMKHEATLLVLSELNSFNERAIVGIIIVSPFYEFSINIKRFALDTSI